MVNHLAKVKRFLMLNRIRLTEDDIPGAKLATSPLKCKASELHRWFASHDMAHLGVRKVEHVKSYST